MFLPVLGRKVRFFMGAGWVVVPACMEFRNDSA